MSEELNLHDISRKYLYDQRYITEIAINELLSNAYDGVINRKLKEKDFTGRIKFYISPGAFALIDNGTGISRDAMQAAVSYGFSNKTLDTQQGGQYGIGMKSATNLTNMLFIISKHNGVKSYAILKGTKMKLLDEDEAKKNINMNINLPFNLELEDSGLMIAANVTPKKLMEVMPWKPLDVFKSKSDRWYIKMSKFYLRYAIIMSALTGIEFYYNGMKIASPKYIKTTDINDSELLDAYTKIVPAYGLRNPLKWIFYITEDKIYKDDQNIVNAANTILNILNMMDKDYKETGELTARLKEAIELLFSREGSKIMAMNRMKKTIDSLLLDMVYSKSFSMTELSYNNPAFHHLNQIEFPVHKKGERGDLSIIQDVSRNPNLVPSIIIEMGKDDIIRTPDPTKIDRPVDLDKKIRKATIYLLERQYIKYEEVLESPELKINEPPQTDEIIYTDEPVISDVDGSYAFNAYETVKNIYNMLEARTPKILKIQTKEGEFDFVDTRKEINGYRRRK